MATIANTDLAALEELFAASILAVTPRQQYRGVASWSRYKRATNTATKMRRFRLIMTPGEFVSGGWHGNRNCETKGVLRVRVDYIGDHSELQAVIHDDWHQLRDVLARNTANTATGLTMLHTSGLPSVVADNDHGRGRLSNSSPVSSDANQVDLVYDFRYNQARA